MASLGDTLKFLKPLTLEFKGDPIFVNLFTGINETEQAVNSITAALFADGPITRELGGPSLLYNNLVAAIYQDDDAHDTCTLTACLNPLHPGPCKGWKHTLFKTSPGAWHALEAAKVEKANKTRLAKIEDLKSKGLPIPKKLLTPVVAKPHPHAGKTAQAAEGEAHEAGKAVTHNAGVHLSEPGKVTLGQAVKPVVKATDATDEKGVKGKKPTVASKGIAHVIAQEKVTPQYKLDKAASITPEQWSALSDDEKAVIRGELAKIQKDGFGPQQKKATDLLAKLDHSNPVAQAQANNAAFHKAATENLPPIKIPEPEKKPEPTKLSEVATPATAVTTGGKKKPVKMSATYQGQTVTKNSTHPYTHAAVVQGPSGKAGIWSFHTSEAHAKKGTLTGEQKKNGFFVKDVVPVTKHDDDAKASVAEAQANNAKHQADAAAEAMKKPIHIATTPTNVAKQIQKDGSAHLLINGKSVEVGFEGSGKEAHLTMTQGGGYTVTMPDGSKVSFGKGEHMQLIPKAAPKVTEMHEPKAAEVAKPLPKHVQDAVAMAKGHAPGASWSKNHLAAYEKLSPAEFQALPLDVRQKIVAELGKAQTKFLDPKKINAAKKLLADFKAAPAAKIENEAEKGADFAKDLHNHAVTKTQARAAVKGTAMSGHFMVAKKLAGVTDAENPDSNEHSWTALAKAKEQVGKLTAPYTPEITKQPAVKAARAEAVKAAQELHQLHEVHTAKALAFNKVNLHLAKHGDELSPIEKASLEHYRNHLLNHPINTDTDALAAAGKASTNANMQLTNALHSELKKANAPALDEMSHAQLTDAATDLIGKEKTNSSPFLNLKEMQTAGAAAQDAVDQELAKHPTVSPGDPTVAAKAAALKNAHQQLIASQMMKSKMANWHGQITTEKTNINGDPLSADDKKTLKAYADKTSDLAAPVMNDNIVKGKEKLAEAQKQFDAAVAAASGPKEPAKLSDYDQETVRAAYAQAWGKAASKAVLHGASSWAVKSKMKEHPEYAQFTQDLGKLQAGAGNLAVLHAHVKVAQDNVPHNLDTGAMIYSSPEYKTLLDALEKRNEGQAAFNQLHKSTQAKLDKIRTESGLQKRALPKLDAAAVKTAAAETGYYKTGGYSGPNYGKSAAAKNYMVAKLGPSLAVPHKTSSDKTHEKLAKAAAKTEKLAEANGAMPAPKVHAKPPSEEVGKGPNPDSAAKQGYHYEPALHTGSAYAGWPKGGSYVASPEQGEKLKALLASPETKDGLGAQKEFKWSINNMTGKGGSTAGKNALYAYTGSSYTNINSKLNSLPPGAKSTGSSQISSIDSAFAAAPPLESDVVLYRGFSSPESVFKSGKWNDVNVAGVEWSQRSYSSTSGQLSTAQSFAGHGGVVMRVIVPKEMGVKGINAKGGQHAGENEIILQRGLRYRVVADHGRGGDGRRYIDVMVVPNPYDKAE